MRCADSVISRQRQISKFAFVQDRLREWRPDVLTKIEHFACMTLATLDIDGFRIDKGVTITVDAQAHWSDSIRTCAKRFGKENFYISGAYFSKLCLIKLCRSPRRKTWEEHKAASSPYICLMDCLPENLLIGNLRR